MIGTKFYKNDYSQEKYAEAADWCNNTQTARIEDKGEYWEVVEWHDPITPEERAKSKAKRFLEATDNYAIRLASGEAQPTDRSSTYDCTFAEIMERRAQERTVLND